MIAALPNDIFHEGQVLNNTWTIEGVLGRGGTGEVYRAKSLVTGRVVAIKALALAFSGDAGYLELMRREEAMRDILHDAVVRYSDCSRTAEGRVFLVMDFIDGPALSEVMATRRVSLHELLVIAHRVAEGLVAAHARGVVHRDLSPDNVILRDGRVEGATVIDFGIAKDMAPGARTVVGNQFAGKYEYAAPEQLDGKAEPASDLYALGALLLAAFRGEVPFAGATPAEMIRRKAEPLDVAGLPEPLAGLIRWLTAPRVPARAPSAAAVVARLDALLQGTGGAAARAVPPARRPRDRTPGTGPGRKLWLALLPLALLIAGGLWLAGVFQSAPPLVQPWRIEAAAGATPRLSGQAPDAASATRIAAAFAQASGTAPPTDALVQASGMPAPGWAEAIAGLFPLLQDLQDWTASVQDMQAQIGGRAASAAARDAAMARLTAWAQASGMALTLDIAAPDLTAPDLLRPEALARALAGAARCGPLTSDLPPEGAPPGAPVTLRGALPDATAGAALAEALRPVLGGRALQLNAEILNPSLCLILAAASGLPEAGLEIRLSEAGRPAPMPGGIYRPGDNPVADVQIPAALAAIPGAELWVAVETGGKVYGVLPRIDGQDTRLDRIDGTGDGAGTVRVLWPENQVAGAPGRVGFRVNDRDFGKTGLFVLVSQGPLFDARRPGEESPAAFAQALAASRADRPDRILGFAYRLLDLRP